VLVLFLIGVSTMGRAAGWETHYFDLEENINFRCGSDRFLCASAPMLKPTNLAGNLVFSGPLSALQGNSMIYARNASNSDFLLERLQRPQGGSIRSVTRLNSQLSLVVTEKSPVSSAVAEQRWNLVFVEDYGGAGGANSGASVLPSTPRAPEGSCAVPILDRSEFRRPDVNPELLSQWRQKSDKFVDCLGDLISTRDLPNAIPYTKQKSPLVSEFDRFISPSQADVVPASSIARDAISVEQLSADIPTVVSGVIGERVAFNIADVVLVPGPAIVLAIDRFSSILKSSKSTVAFVWIPIVVDPASKFISTASQAHFVDLTDAVSRSLGETVSVTAIAADPKTKVLHFAVSGRPTETLSEAGFATFWSVSFQSLTGAITGEASLSLAKYAQPGKENATVRLSGTVERLISDPSGGWIGSLQSGTYRARGGEKIGVPSIAYFRLKSATYRKVTFERKRVR
jgi:hypothetical protein